MVVQAPPRVLHKGFDFENFYNVTSGLGGVGLYAFLFGLSPLKLRKTPNGKIRIPSAKAPPGSLSIYLLAKLFRRHD